MSKIKFIYFDVGGVLVDWKSAFRTVTKKFEIPFSKFIAEWDIYDDDITRGKITPQDFWDKVREDFRIRAGEEFDFLESWIGDYKPILSMHKLVIDLKYKYKIGLLTNIYKGMIPKLLRNKLIPNTDYSSIILSCDEGFKKPEREIYKIAQRKIGSKPEEILLVDDREDFIEGARKLSWQTFLFNPQDLENSIRELKNFLEV